MKGLSHIAILRILLLILALHLGACQTRQGPLIPYVKVYKELLLYADLGDMGTGETRIYPNDGYHGIVLYREDHLLFHAYDLTCTQYPQHDAGCEEDETFTGIFACPDCKSTYVIINDAFPNSGPAQYPLVEYLTRIQGDILVITN